MSIDLSTYPPIAAMATAAAEERQVEPLRPLYRRKRRKPRILPKFTLKCTQGTIDALANALKHRMTKSIKERLKWDVSRAPDFATFCERYKSGRNDESSLLHMLVGDEGVQTFMNQFLSEFNSSKEAYDTERAIASSKRTKPNPAL